MKHELKHIGPIIERKIYDSWQINGYLVSLSQPLLGGISVNIFKGNQSIKIFPTDITHAVILFYLNNCIWACDTDSILSLPEKHFKLKHSEIEEQIKINPEGKVESDGKMAFFCNTPRWAKHKEKFKIQDYPYINTLNEKLICENQKAIEAINIAELRESLKNKKSPI